MPLEFLQNKYNNDLYDAWAFIGNPKGIKNNNLHNII
jgi:beta-xylosidase